MKLTLRDGIATLLVAAILVPYVGYLVNGEMPFIKDPRGMAATGLVLGLLYLTPIVTTLVSDPTWHDRLRKLSPMTAGLAVQSTVDLTPIAPWSGLGVLALWSAAALVAGAAALRFRDA